MALKRSGQTLAEARQAVRKCPQVLINVRLAEKIPGHSTDVLSALAAELKEWFSVDVEAREPAQG